MSLITFPAADVIKQYINTHSLSQGLQRQERGKAIVDLISKCFQGCVITSDAIDANIFVILTLNSDVIPIADIEIKAIKRCLTRVLEKGPESIWQAPINVSLFKPCDNLSA